VTGTGVAVAVVLVFSVMLVSAAPPATPYNLGETLQPACAPGDANCTVVTPAASGANSDITSLSGLTTPLSVPQGGTGLGTIPVDRLLYTSALDTLAPLSLDPLMSFAGGILTLSPTIMVAGENVSLLNNDAGYLKADGTVDLTSDWTIANNNIFLTNGFLWANSITDGIASLGGGTVSDGAGAWLSGGVINGATIQDGAGSSMSGGVVNANTFSDGTLMINGGNVTGASGNVSIWTNDAGYLTSESDPEVGVNTTNYLSKWNGTALVTSIINEVAGKIGINKVSPDVELDVNGTIQQSNAYLFAYDMNGGTVIPQSWTDITFDSETREDLLYSHGADSAEFTFGSTGWYLIITECGATVSDSTRSHADWRLMRDTGGGYNEVLGTAAATYHRNLSDGSSSMSITRMIQVTAGDKIKLQGMSDRPTQVSTLANSCRMYIERK